MESKDLRLVVDHLGPVEHADIALRPLTVFIGRNNTGKTYAAQALYACRQAVRSVALRPVEELNDDERSELEAFTKNRHSALSSDGSSDEALPQPIHDLVARALRNGLEDAGRELERRLKATFGIDELVHITSWENGKNFRLEMRTSGAAGADSCLFGSAGTTAPVGQTIDRLQMDWTEIDHLFPVPALFDQDIAGDERNEFLVHLSWLVTRSYWNSFLDDARLAGNTHYLPAGRSGLLNAWTDVVKLRIQLERERYGLPSFSDPSLDGVALDFISSLADVLGPRSRDRRRRFGFFGPETQSDRDALLTANSLLQDVMEGTISADANDDIVPTLAYQQDDHRIAIRHASSMVADLAPLAIWVDRLLAPGDLLIVDEPESHLHPEAIRLVARVLVRLVNNGVQVVCATHSSVLLHELSNCVLRFASRPSSKNATRGYARDDCLAVEDLAVHRFIRHGSRRSASVEHVPVDPKWGIPEDEFVKVAQDLSDDSAHLIELLA